MTGSVETAQSPDDMEYGLKDSLTWWSPGNRVTAGVAAGSTRNVFVFEAQPQLFACVAEQV